MAKTILVRSGLQKIGFTKNAETGIMQQPTAPSLAAYSNRRSTQSFTKWSRCSVTVTDWSSATLAPSASA